MMNSDTIAAISTGMTDSGISVIRMSGESAFEIIDRVFKSPKNKVISEQKSYTAHFGYIYDKEEMIDEAIVLIMKAPHSYTTEDTVEISCHGGVLVTRKILETLLKNGARIAEPGEFTKRAFLNGRIDLSRAEAVIDVIHAKNDFALKSSEAQLKGNLSKKIGTIREHILDAAAFIEAALDDPEHISLEGYGDELETILNDDLKEISRLIASFKNGKILKEGIKTVILGKPNAGKSSLMNLFAGEDKAIVTEIAGTTRDVISEQVQIGGIGFQILDTAGIHKTEDIVEKIGIERSMEQAKQADLILYVVDSSVPLDENDREIIHFLRDKKNIIVYNKSDLEAKVDLGELQQLNDQAKVVKISAKEGTGFEELGDVLKKMFEEGSVSMNDQVIITNMRHEEALKNAKNSMENVIESIHMDMPEDFWTIDLKDAYESLGFITGESVTDDVINRIFKKFCMGK